ncbi:MAG: PSD1 and planctomycete cytochrome C domain-containing protein [Rubripirellula sp.]|nr:PSD1 and planctomycete cytochrome C domain-containing protein [Rubripirellula sp.]
MGYQLRTYFVLLASFVVAAARAEEVDFARDIRPILSENCSFCHGPDEETREADLRLDTATGAANVIEPNDSEASELYRRLITDDVDELMPPPESNRQLSKREIELIRKWIESGASWEQHWSFQSIREVEVPQVSVTDHAPVRNPIDAFVQQKLADRGISPSPEASRSTLIRRLSLDLTGLPPTPEQVATFLADSRPDAYERLVDQLLDSPAYGIRMAWPWLDAARYADTNGYQGDRERTMWPWRDWVVDAFNNNLPFDQFTTWQLAGDLIPDATPEQKLATGFCRNHMINGEGGRIPEENRVEYVMDMSETMGTVWLGLTLNCCRCHDHKYDPISNREYYQLFAFFNQTPVNGGGGDPQTAPNLAVPNAQQASELDTLAKQISDLDKRLQNRDATLTAEQPNWEKQQLAGLSREQSWRLLTDLQIDALHGTSKLLDDQSILIDGDAINDDYTILASPGPSKITGMRLETLRHASHTGNGLSRSDSGNFVLTDFLVSVSNGENSAPMPVTIASADATFEQGSHAITNAFDNDPKSGWAVYEGRTVDRNHTAVFRFAEPIELVADSTLQISLRHQSVHARHNIGRFRLAVTSDDRPSLSNESDQLLAALSVETDKRSDDQRSLIQSAHRSADDRYQKLRSDRDKQTKRRDDLRNSLPKVMVMEDMSNPRETFVLNRGLYNKPTDKVQAKLPEFLPKPEASDQSVDRLLLAKWLVNADNPLTARVTVNRFWQQVFGIGLVKTTEDFGTQGETPIQLDLLNWLSWQFREDSWNVKNLIRLIVTSHTYRQTSKLTDRSAYDQDPANRLLARGSRYRLPSWMLRDQALAASGLLSPVASGPAVNAYQPPGIWEDASFGKKKYQQDQGEKLYRRSLFVFWRRIIAPTMFFDNASRQTCTVGVNRTNTPLHALQTLNDVTFVEASRALAETALGSPAQSDSDRIDRIMQRVLARPCSPAERHILLSGLERTRLQFADHPAEAVQLLDMGDSPRNETLDAAEHAAWTSLTLAILNLDETLNRE